MRLRMFGLLSRRLDRSRLRRPQLGAGESLEQRSMLSASFDPGTGALRLVGTDRNDAITLNTVNAGRTLVHGSVRVSGVAGVRNGQVFTGVTSVTIEALRGNDLVTVAPGLKAVDGTYLGATIDAGSGKDVVQGGHGVDTILGGSGRDIIRGGRGDDNIDGGGGDDDLRGEEGDDLLIGDAGRDRMWGGRGNDSLYGGTDADTLHGDSGDDDLDGGLGNDDLYGGRGNDDDVDDDDSLDDRDDEDLDDNDNKDENEHEKEDDDNGRDDDPVGTPITLVDGRATLNGTSANRQDKVYYSFEVTSSASLRVTMLDVAGGRYPDLGIERQGAGAEVEVELEPRDGDPTTGTFTLPPGRYSLRLRSPSVLPVTFSVDLLVTIPMP